MQIKIGKIDNTSILNDIKNNKSNGFADLLSYAKNNDGIFDKILDCDSDNYAISYTNPDNGLNLLDTYKLQDKAYYFLYVKPDDENGKYYPVEAVTFAQAELLPDYEWYLFYYGSDDFKWTNFDGNGTPIDTTKSPKPIPQTGESALIIAGVTLVALVSVVSINRLKKYRDAK